MSEMSVTIITTLSVSSAVVVESVGLGVGRIGEQKPRWNPPAHVESYMLNVGRIFEGRVDDGIQHQPSASNAAVQAPAPRGAAWRFSIMKDDELRRSYKKNRSALSHPC